MRSYLVLFFVVVVVFVVFNKAVLIVKLKGVGTVHSNDMQIDGSFRVVFGVSPDGDGYGFHASRFTLRPVF